MGRKPAPQGRPDPAKATPQQTVEATLVQVGVIKLCIRSHSPFLFHRKSQKAWQTLLMGGSPSRKPADRKGILKHQPMPEFQESVYRTRDPRNATLLLFPCSAFHQASQTAALDTPKLAKSEIGRWITVEGGPRARDGTISPETQNYVNMYGVPQITLDMVRNLGQTRAPDVRCKAILPEWACEIFVLFAQPNLNRAGVVNLMANGGVLAGVGDGRKEKGKLSLGMFTICQPDDPVFLRIKASGGRKAQEDAMANPAPYSEETEELLRWYDDELLRRQASGQAPEIDDDDDLPEIEEC